MILRVTANFRDHQYIDDANPKGTSRIPGTYIDVPKERAEELIKARVAEAINVIKLDQYKKGQAPEADEEPKEAKVIELEDMTVADLTKMLEESGIEIPKKAKKADLIDLLK